MNVNTYDATPVFDGVVNFGAPKREPGYRYFRRNPIDGANPAPWLYRWDGRSEYLERESYYEPGVWYSSTFGHWKLPTVFTEIKESTTIPYPHIYKSDGFVWVYTAPDEGIAVDLATGRVTPAVEERFTDSEALAW